MAEPDAAAERFDRLTDRQQERLLEALDTEDVAGEVTAAYLAYQEALVVFNRVGTVGLRGALGELFRRLGQPVPELARLGRTLDRWMPEIVATSRPAPPTLPPRAATAR